MEHLMTCMVRLSDIVQQVIIPSWRRKITVKMALSYTHLHAKISCVHTKGKPEDKIIHTAIWNVTQDSLNLAHKCGLTFRNRWSPHCPVLFKTYTQIGFYIPVTSKTIGATKHLQKTACVQADIHMKPLRPMPAARTSNQMELFNRLGSTSFYKATLTYLDRMILPVHSCLKVSRAFQDTTINQVWLPSSNSMWDPQLQRRHEKAICKLWLKTAFFWQVTSLTKLF